MCNTNNDNETLLCVQSMQILHYKTNLIKVRRRTFFVQSHSFCIHFHSPPSSRNHVNVIMFLTGSMYKLPDLSSFG